MHSCKIFKSQKIRKLEVSTMNGADSCTIINATDYALKNDYNVKLNVYFTKIYLSSSYSNIHTHTKIPTDLPSSGSFSKCPQ